MIVDSQVHVWRAETPDRPWAPGGAGKAQMPEPFSYERLLGMMDEAGVDRCVIVPPSWEGNRNDYGLEAARRHPDRFGVVGRLPLHDPASAALVPNWLDQPGMLGVRVTFMEEEQARLLTEGRADWFWPLAEKAGIPVMALAPDRIGDLGRVAARHEGLPIIVDHMGMSVKIAREDRCAEAVEAVVALAGLPNVSVKVSSAPTYSRESYPFADMSEHIRRLFDAFGPHRCFWGTDYTNSPAKGSYEQRKTHFTEHLSFLGRSDLALVMGDALLARLHWA